MPLGELVYRACRRAGGVRHALVALLALVPLAGCTLVQEPQLRELAGPTDGYTPTSVFLKLHVLREDGTTALLDFERRDWHVAEIAKRVDHKQLKFVVAQAMPRAILNEYVAQAVASPADLQSLRFDEMGATPEQRAEMDREYEALLQAWLAQAPAPEAQAPALPALTLP